MADEVTIQEVGVGTEVQVVIGMEAIGGKDLRDFNWQCTFEGTNQFVVQKSDAYDLENGSYECLVKTLPPDGTGKGEIKAWLTVYNIPTIHNGDRVEVTPPIAINLKVV